MTGSSLPEPTPGPGPAGSVARRDVRASDEDRQAVVDDLRTHCAAGRLELAEFEDRARAAWAARVWGELELLLADLPELRPRPSGPPVRERPARPVHARRRSALAAPPFRIHLYVWLVLSAFWVVIWAATAGDGTFWPIYPIAGVGLTVGLHAAIRQGSA